MVAVAPGRRCVQSEPRMPMIPPTLAGIHLPGCSRAVTPWDETLRPIAHDMMWRRPGGAPPTARRARLCTPPHFIPRTLVDVTASPTTWGEPQRSPSQTMLMRRTVPRSRGSSSSSARSGPSVQTPPPVSRSCSTLGMTGSPGLLAHTLPGAILTGPSVRVGCRAPRDFQALDPDEIPRHSQGSEQIPDEHFLPEADAPQLSLPQKRTGAGPNQCMLHVAEGSSSSLRG